MSIKSIGAWIAGVLLALAVAAPGSVNAGNLQRAQVVGNMNVYLGVMAADAIRVRHASLVEQDMHGGIPSGEDVYHVLVTLFDRKSGERIEDAAVTARVAHLGLGGTGRTLEVMYSAGVVCYCNWFEMTAGETYRISVLIERPGEPAQSTHFEYTPD
jgi:hypothetical protein